MGCVFKCLHKELGSEWQSHTGRICLTFLHCAFLNASSKHQLKKMQSHIGCNCARHCELCAALCAHDCRKRLWSHHKGKGYVTIERKEEVMSQLRGRKRLYERKEVMLIITN